MNRVDLAGAVALGAGALALYVATLCPTIYTEDSPEFSTAAAVFGVPHPPGYPLYTMLCGLFVRAVRVGDMAYRSNLFSAVCGALTVTVLWLLVRRLGIRRVAALAATLCFALGGTFWSQSLVAEVHAFNCLLLTIALLCTVEGARAPSKLSFAIAGAAVGLLVGHRNLNALYVPALFAVLEVARRRVQGCRCFYSWAAGAAAVALAVYVYLPLAGRHDPPLYVGAPSTWGRFYAVVTAQPYLRHFGSGPAAANVGRVIAFVMQLPSNLGVAALAAPVGLWVARRRTGPLLPAALAYIALMTIVFGAAYNVIDVAAYFLPAHLVLAIAAAFAFDAIPGRARFAVPVLALALALPGSPWTHSVSLRTTRLPDGYARDLLRSAPPKALVIPFGDTARHALGYLQAVERARPDAVVVSPDDVTDWYIAHLRRQHPDVDWPPEQGSPGGPAATDVDWFMTVVRNNLGKRPICLTHPLALGLSDWIGTPVGLLTCFRPKSAPTSATGLAPSVAFWNDATQPTTTDLSHPDVHIRMLAFSYAMSRFALAQTLAETGDIDAARAQLQAVATLHPDDQEQAITAAMKTIGREPPRPFHLGAKTARALQTGAGNVESLRGALADDPR